MNKLIFILLLLFILLISCTDEIEVPAGITADSSDFETYSTCVEQCGQCETTCLDTLYFTKAVSSSNENICEHIQSTMLKQDCQQQLLGVEAVAELNKGKCELLPEEIREGCLVDVTVEIAIQSSNIAKCNEVENAEHCRELYFRELAVQNNDASYCDNIEDQSKQELCVDIVESLEI
ncbi:hypothetical protein COV16_04545 [Candidatus Woesearchaeota archaeon CG10_big_fil_rev_8_21_14_0_10_34_8]|nr:MAG: hypothetical protein COV16_04545 [Candidatus Woesearchaeota archaeon CG10_big_fil_rev_8_21_14_0_10_34_8]